MNEIYLQIIDYAGDCIVQVSMVHRLIMGNV